ncbi:MAG: creatininase family protein [Armatimonadota bacterium]|nr:creatininase family protein [Armatimonadota bacterium]MDR7485951.1 creatininase family protein [Armatimonadota bacterium]MDR7532171.1 creatininase family protein [Armatimonadota bacterium]MDR7537293.1 creatininase family protein [Armatimonadota bacterium]
MKLPHRYWHELTTKEFAALDAARVIAVLPVGAIEQHGPHLPVWVDAAIADTVVRRTLDLLPADLPVLVLPTLPVGKSNEHLTFPGTLSLSAETLMRLWSEVGESVARAGVRKLVLLNSHGGQAQLVDVVARDLRVRTGMTVVAVNIFLLGVPPGLFPDAELRHGIHAGAAETSMMLHIRADLVHRDEARPFPSQAAQWEQEFRHLSPTGPIRVAWQIQDLHPLGACGDASDADAGRGRLLIEHAAARVVEVLRELDRFPPPGSP